MNTEFFAIGMMMDCGGLGLLIVAGLFFAALDLARSLFVPAAKRSRVTTCRGFAQKLPSRAASRRERLQLFQ